MPKSNCDLANSDTDVDIETLQEAISEEYRFVIGDPREDFHFHTGRPLAAKLDYSEDWLANLPLEVAGYEAKSHSSPSLAVASH